MTTPYYKGQEKLFVAVDSIILGFKKDKLYLLITKRKIEPMKGRDSLMGGFIQVDESLSEAATRVVYEYTGMQDVFMEQVGAYGDIGRDLGERVISIAYYALIDIQLFEDEICEKHDARWVELEKVGDLIFDHNQMLADTLNLIRNKAASKPIGFNLLPEKFTLPQLQSLYEAIYQNELDKRNFRKKINEMDFLEKQEDKDKSSSKRGAFYYKFNKDRYDQLSKSGYYFSL